MVCYLLVMLELVNIALAIYRLVVLEPGHLRRRSTLHLADDAQLLAVLHRRVARQRANRRDRCVLCCKTTKKTNNKNNTRLVCEFSQKSDIFKRFCQRSDKVRVYI